MEETPKIEDTSANPVIETEETEPVTILEDETPTVSDPIPIPEPTPQDKRKLTSKLNLEKARKKRWESHNESQRMLEELLAMSDSSDESSVTDYSSDSDDDYITAPKLVTGKGKSQRLRHKELQEERIQDLQNTQELLLQMALDSKRKLKKRKSQTINIINDKPVPEPKKKTKNIMIDSLRNSLLNNN